MIFAWCVCFCTRQTTRSRFVSGTDTNMLPYSCEYRCIQQLTTCHVQQMSAKDAELRESRAALKQAEHALAVCKDKVRDYDGKLRSQSNNAEMERAQHVQLTLDLEIRLAQALAFAEKLTSEHVSMEGQLNESNIARDGSFQALKRYAYYTFVSKTQTLGYQNTE